MASVCARTAIAGVRPARQQPVQQRAVRAAAGAGRPSTQPLPLKRIVVCRAPSMTGWRWASATARGSARQGRVHGGPGAPPHLPVPRRPPPRWHASPAGNGAMAPTNPQLLEVLQGVANGTLTPDDGAVQLGMLVGQSRLGGAAAAVERAAFPEVRAFLPSGVASSVGGERLPISCLPYQGAEDATYSMLHTAAAQPLH